MTYKDPPMELLDMRFGEKVGQETRGYHLCLFLYSTLAVKEGPGRSSPVGSELIAQYVNCVDPDTKSRAAILLGAHAYELFYAAHGACDRPTPGVSVFMAAVARCWAEGVKDDRTEFSWMDIDWDVKWEKKYAAKAMRHLSVAEDPSVELSERIKHAAAVYCNANILWHHCGLGHENM